MLFDVQWVCLDLGSTYWVFSAYVTLSFYSVIHILTMGMNSGRKSTVSGPRISSRVDTHGLKHEIERKIGRSKTEQYCHLLASFFSNKLSKLEFNKLCLGLVGKENICLHNRFIQAIIRNACVANSTPKKYGRGEVPLKNNVTNGSQTSTPSSFCKNILPQSPTLRDHKVNDRLSPVGPHGKTHNIVHENVVPKIHEQQSATELLSLGSRPPVEVNSVEEGEEVEQAAGSPGIHSRFPVTAPLGISLNVKGNQKVLSHDPASFHHVETCHGTYLLPDTSFLKKRLKQNLDAEGLNISMDCTNLLNNALDVYMKRLIKPCIQLAASRAEYKLLKTINHRQSGLVVDRIRSMRYAQSEKQIISASVLDFKVVMESNPRLLGVDWPLQLEKVCLTASEDH